MTQSIAPAEIHPRITDPLLPSLLSQNSPLWTPRQLNELTSTVTTELTTALRGLLRFDADQRWWARLALTDGVELWLLSWLPGQQTRPHDHGGAAGSFTVLQGELTEEYRYPGGPVRQRVHTAGDGLGFGAGRAHRVGNASAAPAASVHAYSPPLVPTREYSTLAEVPAETPPLPVIVP
ncbi:cysteine dioxygenase [Amycolatopsis aidingensis]|uniref:cysteine dioxygenase n=1 Tax=Amycolatopsis aidingensis TaxID=2842453 RepID=UPI001C0DDDC3|nr:cysteine dioxygenase family protein [Amycolatopsis aidingensis]